MARTTISIPDELKDEMDALGNNINWSATAAEAFRAAIVREKVRRQRTEGKRMKAAISRLQTSKSAYRDEARDRGHEDGVTWASESAEYGELKRLSDACPDVDLETFETSDALGAPGCFLRAISGDETRRSEIEDFWTNLGKDQRDHDLYSPAYWAGFAEGALEVFEQVD